MLEDLTYGLQKQIQLLATADAAPTVATGAGADGPAGGAKAPAEPTSRLDTKGETPPPAADPEEVDQKK